jgi:hypothetical protein
MLKANMRAEREAIQAAELATMNMREREAIQGRARRPANMSA